MKLSQEVEFPAYETEMGGSDHHGAVVLVFCF